MARNVHEKDIAPILAAAERWIQTCIVADRSIFASSALWTSPLVEQAHHAFVDHPDYGSDDFVTTWYIVSAIS
jgi:5-methylcytosine-specific restriction enzyme B